MSFVAGVLRAHDPASGAVRWSLTISTLLSGNASVVSHDNGRIFIASSRGLHVVNTATRQNAWSDATAMTVTPAVADGVVYAIRASGATIDARSAANGTLIRSFSTGSANATQVIATSDALVAVTSSTTLVFRRDGTGTARTLPVGGVGAVQGGALFIGETTRGNSSRIFCYRSARTDDLPPTATAANSSVTEDLSGPVTMAGNDPEGSSLAAVIETQPANGTLFQTVDGVTPGPAITIVSAEVTHPGMSVIYRPVPDGFGPAFDSFRFRVNDGRYFSAAAVATVDDTGVNDAPAAVSNQSAYCSADLVSGLRHECSSAAGIITSSPAPS